MSVPAEDKLVYDWAEAGPHRFGTAGVVMLDDETLRDGLQSPSVIARLREAFPDLPDDPDPKTVFLKLRELRNSW